MTPRCEYAGSVEFEADETRPAADALVDEDPNGGVAIADEASEHAQGTWSTVSSAGLVVSLMCSLFVLNALGVADILRNTTPSGGDMGAHVWGPAYMRDHLLSEGRLVGWTPDWYAGFPAYHFYMVVPPLLIIWLNAGFHPLLALSATLVLAAVGVYVGPRIPSRLRVHAASLALVAVLFVWSVPYGPAFKVVTILGLTTFPVMAWAMARLMRAHEPIPALAPIAATVFLFDTNFTIYGGNIQSTLAGEFAFSISLALSLLALGLAARGMDTGRHRVVAAVVICLVALTHVIPVFFMVVALAVVALLRPGQRWYWPVVVIGGFAAGAVALSENVPLVAKVGVGVGVVALVVVMNILDDKLRPRALWLVLCGPIAACMAAFWLLPFYLRAPYFNDMGWERLEEWREAIFTAPMKVALPFAAVGLLLSIGRRERIGILFGALAVAAGVAVITMPESALWNARLLPFFYLSVYLAGAVGIGLVVRLAIAASAHPDEHGRWSFDLNTPAMFTAITLLAVGTLIGVSVPLRWLPGGSENESGEWHWLGLVSNSRSQIRVWAPWNYTGYEEKRSYREYHGMVQTMDELGQTNGCGRAMWEYNQDLDRYGTPMAPMLLPHWTDGCISSMEGLYFESSATTPFHFLNQSVLSDAPSRAQRDLPYRSFDINLGVAQLQTMGVRYYMALSDTAIAAADEHPDLELVAEAPPWRIYEVAHSELVEALSFEPVITTGPELAEGEDETIGSRFDEGWLSQAVEFYNDVPNFQAIPAEDGPSSWAEVTTLLPSDGVPLDPVEVTLRPDGIDNASITFDVDKTGVPVLVKISYFPNWKADGAAGPWRVGPNLMVVVPEETTVTMSYGYTSAEFLGYGVTLLGLLGLFGLFLLDRKNRPLTLVPASVKDVRKRRPEEPMVGDLLDPAHTESGTFGPASDEPHPQPDLHQLPPPRVAVAHDPTDRSDEHSSVPDQEWAPPRGRGSGDPAAPSTTGKASEAISVSAGAVIPPPIHPDFEDDFNRGEDLIPLDEERVNPSPMMIAAPVTESEGEGEEKT